MGAHAVSLGDRLLRPRRVRQFEERLEDGATTTVYVATYPRRTTRVRVVALDRPEPLHRWARSAGVGEAISGGFYVAGGTPLGELHSDGNVHMTVPFEEPWDACRSCLSIAGDEVEIAPRGVLPNRARGDLLQAGPLLVANARAVIGADARDPQGFAAGAGQFDHDITAGRHPRAGLGIARDRFFAVVCDGGSIRDAGMTLAELARLMADLGADSALNLCGGASASLVSGGALHNRPRDQNGVSLLGGRPVASAIVFDR
ncbi:MAG TPA: phosphodiester glycosidase family protein [Thermoleophilaceae bacterium]